MKDFQNLLKTRSGGLADGIMGSVNGPTRSKLSQFIRVSRTAAIKLQKAFRDAEIYVSASEATSIVPFCHLSKAFQVHAAVLVLCEAGFGAEAYALSRSILEMSMSLRWITNKDQVKRADSFAYFEAKRKQYVAQIHAKYNPTSQVSADIIQFVETLYKRYAEKYASFKFWSNVPNNLKDMAAEQELLYPTQEPPYDNDLWHYEVPYSLTSDYVHCTSVAMSSLVPPQTAPYQPKRVDEPKLVEQAIFSATQWLFDIARRVNAYRNLDMRDEIRRAQAPSERFARSL